VTRCSGREKNEVHAPRDQPAPEPRRKSLQFVEDGCLHAKYEVITYGDASSFDFASQRPMRMKRHLVILALFTASLSLAACGNPLEELSFTQSSSLGSDVTTNLSRPGVLDGYAVTAHLNPYYLHADFDGDGRQDTALLVRHKASSKRGIAVLHSSDGRVHFIGAGTSVGSGGDNFDWMDAWHVQRRGPVGKGPHNDTEPPILKGDALHVIKTESASGLLYWSGERYEWYQRSD
jgi:hypothetical protein